MNTVFIADDELIIRQGIKCIIDWEQLGFEIIGEASNGEDALNFILSKKPDLVLMDIRMPKMLGLEVVENARKRGFNGKVIILSGYTDFKYAQAAIKNGVDYYLTKPIDEDELYETVSAISSQINKEAKEEETLSNYRDKAKGMILFDILTGVPTINNIADMNIHADIYQVVIYRRTLLSTLCLLHTAEKSLLLRMCIFLMKKPTNFFREGSSVKINSIL